MNLQQRFKNCSDIAACSNIIQKLENNSLLTNQETNWLFNIFRADINNHEEGRGELVFLLYRHGRNSAEQLMKLGDKIYQKQKLNDLDWKLILDGLIWYRKHLLSRDLGGHCE